MVKVGLISAWHVHAPEYAKELTDSKKASISAVWDNDEIRGQKIAAEYGAVFFGNYDDFLAQADISAVICGAPTTLHTELLCKAAAAKKNIFTEKLLATTVKDCALICKAIEENRVIFTISLPLLSDSRILYVKKLLEDGTLGKVTGARMRRSHGGVSDGWLPDYWFDLDSTGGGAMMDLGAHAAYILSFLFGEPKRVSGMMTNLFGTSSDENAVALVEFNKGVIGMCETAFVTFGVPDLLEVYGTEGSVFVHGNRILLSTKETEKEGHKEVEIHSLPKAMPSPLLQFLDACVHGTGSPKYLGTDAALMMTKMIEASYASDISGNAVRFS